MRKILLTFLTTLLCSITAWGANGDVLFSQNFNSATAVAYAISTARTYTVASGDNNIVGSTAASQFTYIAVTSTDKAGIAINSSTGGNSVDATGIFQAYCNSTGHKYSLVKTTDFAATAPKAIKVSMKILFKQLSSGSAYSATFAIGDDFSDGTAAPAASNVHSGFSISNNSTAYFCPYLTYTGFSGSSSITQNSWLTITWVINNSGETLTYTNPNSTSSTLANDKFDVWVGTTRFLEAQSASTATKDLQNLYIGDPSGKKHELRLDDIVVTDLTPSTSCSTPAAPTAVTAGSITSSGTTLTITDDADAASYDIYYSTSNDLDEDTEATTTTTSKTPTLTGLTASTTYYVWVRSVCDESNKSDWVALTGSTFTTLCTSHTVTAATNNASYGTAAAASTTVCEGSTTTITATPNTGYSFVSWAVSGTGSTLSSTSDNPTTLTMGTANATVTATFGCATPSAPSALVASSTTSSGTTLTITDAANTNNYEIYYSTSSTAPEAGTSATETSTSKTKALTGLSASTTYYVWVRSVCDESNKSDWVALDDDTFTTDAACTDPDLTITLN